MLTQKEFLLLLLLAEKVSGYTAADELVRDIWGGDPAEDRNVIHATVSRLNKKLDSVNAGVRVAFQRGEGYILEEL